MPEGPEAHTIARKLNDVVSGLYILSVSGLDVQAMPLPNKILNVSAYGKRPIFTLETGYIVSFLAMTGRWSFTEDAGTKIKIELGTYNTIKLAGNIINVTDVTTKIYYCGHGASGKVTYLKDKVELSNYFKCYGPDMLSSPPSIESYKQILQRVSTKHQHLCVFLLEQEYVCGVGNYLRSDIMYYSKLHPMRLVSSLNDDEILRLYNSTIYLMKLSFQFGGMSFSDYIDPYGEKGKYPRLVYRMKQDSNGETVSVLDAPDGRKVYWVQSVQV